MFSNARDVQYGHNDDLTLKFTITAAAYSLLHLLSSGGRLDMLSFCIDALADLRIIYHRRRRNWNIISYTLWRDIVIAYD